jgi:hypothetical protein
LRKTVPTVVPKLYVEIITNIYFREWGVGLWPHDPQMFRSLDEAFAWIDCHMPNQPLAFWWLNYNTEDGWVEASAHSRDEALAWLRGHDPVPGTWLMSDAQAHEARHVLPLPRAKYCGGLAGNCPVCTESCEAKPCPYFWGSVPQGAPPIDYRKLVP